MTTKDKKSGTSIQRLVFGALVPSVMAASAQEREQLVSQTRESLALKDEKYKDSPLDIVFPTRKSYFSEKDLEAEALEGPSKRGGSAAKAAPKKHLRDPNKMESKDELEDPGVLQAYQVSGPASGLSNGSGASFEDDNTLYFVIDRVKKAQPVSVDLAKHTPANGGKTSRRANKRAPEAEGEHVEVRTRKAKADNEQDPPGIVLGGNGIVWIDGSGKCVQGTSSFVKSTCDALGLGCCNRENSCEWPSDQTATVCQNSCTGPFACEDIGDGAVIEKDSCKGLKSCYELAKAKTSGKIRVGKESCTDSRACAHICSESEHCELTIDAKSCTGDESCYFICAESEHCELTIATESCTSDEGCEYICSKSEHCELTIGTESCTTDSACGYICYESENCKVAIGDKSCTGGKEACEQIGQFAAKEIIIGDNSCNGVEACEFLAWQTTKTVKVGSDSCDGKESCIAICWASEKCELTIGDEACLGSDACNYVGGTEDDDEVVPNTRIEKVDIEYGACDGVEACYYFGGNSTSIKIGKEACQGTESCEYFGYNSLKKVEAGDYSCDGTSACQKFGYNIVDKDVKVDKNECIGNKLCSSDACEDTAKVPNKDGLCPATT